MFQYYRWNDSRILINDSHHYWDPDDNGYKLKLSGPFVEECLWITRFSFASVIGLSSWHSTPTTSVGPPMEVFLTREGRIEIVMDRFHVTLACAMDFSKYPFDIQVKLSRQFSDYYWYFYHP